MSGTHATMTLAQFCDHINVKRSYGHELKRAGRLVLAEDGKSVLVAESIARIAATRDPSKAGVAARHAAERGAAAQTGHADAAADAEGDAAGDDGAPDGVPLYDFQTAKAKREHWAAEREHTAYRKEAGELIERSVHVAQFAAAGAQIRADLEALAAMLPPQLVGRDEASIRATMADQVEQVLRAMTDRITELARQVDSAAGSADV